MSLFGKNYKDWHLETDLGAQSNFSEKKLIEVLDGLDRCEVDYFIISPPKPVEQCNFIQACKDTQNGGFSVEISFLDAAGRNEMYGKTGYTFKALKELVMNFVNGKQTPKISDWSGIGTFENSADADLYAELAMRISGDENVANSLSYCFTNPKGYFREHEREYVLRDMHITDTEDDIRWIGIVDALIKHGSLCELDYKEGVDEFISAIKAVAGRKNIVLNQEWIEELYNYKNDKITTWCEKLDDKLRASSLCIAGMDIDSDCYVLFISSFNDLKRLQELCDKLDNKIIRKQINFAKNM